MMRAAEKVAEGTRCVHVIDREGNAVFYLAEVGQTETMFLRPLDYSRLCDTKAKNATFGR